MDFDVQTFKTLLTNEKAQLLYQLPSQSNTQRSSKTSQTYRPPSSHRVVIPANKDLSSRTLLTESDTVPTQEDQPKSEVSAMSRTMRRPQSAVFKAVNINMNARHAILRQHMSKANIRATTKLNLDHFYDNIYRVKKESEELNNKIENLQSSFEMIRTRTTWNVAAASKGKNSFTNMKPGDTYRSGIGVRLPTEEDEKQYTGDKESNPPSMKVTPVLSKESTVTNFFKEISTSRKSARKSGKDELFSATSVKDVHYNSFIKAYQGVKNDLQISSNREKGKKSKGEDPSPVNKGNSSSNLLKIKDITANMRRDDCFSLKKEKKDNANVPHGESTLLLTSHSSVDLNVSTENMADMQSRRSNIAITQNMFLNQKDFNGSTQGSSPRKGTPLEGQRPISGRSTKSIPLGGMFGSEYKEKMEIINQTIYLQGKKMAYEGLSKTNRHYSPSRNDEYYANSRRGSRQETSELYHKPLLMICGQRWNENTPGPRQIKRSASNPRLRDPNPLGQDANQYVTFQKGIKGLGPTEMQKNAYKRPASGIRYGSSISKGMQKMTVESWFLKDKPLSSGQMSQKKIK